MRRSVRALCAFVVVALGSAALNATTFIRMSPQKLIAAASLVIRGRCVGNIIETRGVEIWTITSFEVIEAWKGSAAPVIRTRLLGGRTRELTSYVAGVPRFRAGEEVVLFLIPLRDGEYSVLSWAQGTFRVHRDPATRMLLVTQDTASYSGMTTQLRTSGDGLSNFPLEEFHHQIEIFLSTDSGNAQSVGRH